MCADLYDCTYTEQTGDKHHCVYVPRRHATVHKHKVKLGLIQIKMSWHAQELRVHKCMYSRCNPCLVDGKC